MRKFMDTDPINIVRPRASNFGSRIFIVCMLLIIAIWLHLEYGNFWLPSELYVFHEEAPLYNPLDPSLVYTFNEGGILNETGKMTESTSPFWWLDSGGELVIAGGIGRTFRGALPAMHRWRLEYGITNPMDTDNGYHPQNIFRLISRSRWDNVRVEGFFCITKDELSKSANRNVSNGLLLMSRYVDHDTFYYAGIRVDGTAVIKKKYHGIYYPMAQIPIFEGEHEQVKNPDLLPHNEWLGLRNETYTNIDGSVNVRLFVKRERGPWEKVLEASDHGSEFGNTPPILTPEYIGIRTDFMDVEFDNFRIERISDTGECTDCATSSFVPRLLKFMLGDRVASGAKRS